jgi:flagellar biosynthesis protein FlhA
VDLLALEVGYGLIPLVDREQGGELLERIRSYRSQVAREVGILVPSVHIQDNLQLKPAEYAVLLRGNPVGRGELMMHHLLAIDPGDARGKLSGVSTREPTYGLPALWIRESEKETALASGYTVVDLATVLTTHLSEIIRRHAHELIGRQEVQQLVEAVRERNPKVVEELIPSLLPIGGVVKVLQNLLREQIPVRDLVTILEALADWAPMTKDIDLLTEQVRQALARTITRIHQAPDGSVPLVTMEPSLERMLNEALQHTEQGSYLALDPTRAQKIVQALSRKLERFTAVSAQPVVLCSSAVRAHFKRLTERLLPQLVVLSHNDLLPDARIQSLGTVGVSDAD